MKDSDNEFTWDNTKDSIVRGIFDKPRTHIIQYPREISNIGINHIEDLIRHSKNVKITALTDEDITKPNVDLTKAKERWLLDEMTKYKKFKG